MSEKGASELLRREAQKPTRHRITVPSPSVPDTTPTVGESGEFAVVDQATNNIVFLTFVDGKITASTVFLWDGTNPANVASGPVDDTLPKRFGASLGFTTSAPP